MNEIVEVFNRLADLLKKVQDMAGGKKRGYLVFWVCFALAVFLLAKPAYDSVSFVLGKINLASPITNAIAGLIFFLTGFVVLFAVVTLLAALIGQLMRSSLESAFRIRLNDTFIALLDALHKADNGDLNQAQIKTLLSDTEKLYTAWQKSKTNAFVHWVAPQYFKKDLAKWKVVAVEAPKAKVVSSGEKA